jgi:hypothetical protein
MREYPEVTTAEMARAPNLTDSGVNYHFRRLRHAVQIRSEDSTMAGSWVVLP